MATVTRAPANLIVATSDGIDVRFAGVEIGPRDWQDNSGISVTLEAVRDEETHRRDCQLADAREAWAAEFRRVGKAEGSEAPVMPAIPVLGQVQAHLTDDVDTKYVRTTGRVAGDGGTEWRATWFFSPLPPTAATELRLHFSVSTDDVRGGEGPPPDSECRIALP